MYDSRSYRIYIYTQDGGSMHTMMKQQDVGRWETTDDVEAPYSGILFAGSENGGRN